MFIKTYGGFYSSEGVDMTYAMQQIICDLETMSDERYDLYMNEPPMMEGQKLRLVVYYTGTEPPPLSTSPGHSSIIIDQDHFSYFDIVRVVGSGLVLGSATRLLRLHRADIREAIVFFADDLNLGRTSVRFVGDRP